jgi:hypothetical protein
MNPAKEKYYSLASAIFFESVGRYSIVICQQNAPFDLKQNDKIATPTCFSTPVPSSGDALSSEDGTGVLKLVGLAIL